MAQNVNFVFPELANSQNEKSVLRPFLAIFSKERGSDGHFEVLNQTCTVEDLGC